MGPNTLFQVSRNPSQMAKNSVLVDSATQRSGALLKPDAMAMSPQTAGGGLKATAKPDSLGSLDEIIIDGASDAVSAVDVPPGDSVVVAQAGPVVAGPPTAATGVSAGAAGTVGSAGGAAMSAGASLAGAIPSLMLAGVAGLAVAAGVSVSSDSGPSNPPDTTPPPNPRLALAADTGVLGTDAVTNVGVVNVSGLESGATWEYSTNGGGSWSAGSGSSFALSGDGAKTVIVRQTDAAGNSATSAALRFTLDTVTATPVVNLVATDDTVNSAEKLTGVIVKGTAEAEASVAVTWGSLTKVVTATSGAWSVNFSSADVPADATDSTISAVATDVAGNASAAGARVVTVDTLAPTTPVIGVVATDDIINAAERGATVTVTGTKEAGATVTLNGQATTVVDATSWSYVLDAAAIGAFGEGAQTLTAIATDAAGNVNATNGTRAITVDTVAPVISLLSATGATGTVVLTYDGPLDASNVALASNFTVTTADTVNPVTAVAVAGSVITLTVSAFTPGSITVAYADPTAGDDTAAIQDAAGNDAVGFSTGVVADGYVRGAMVYIDTNSNGIADPGLDYLVGSTNINGNFFLSTDAPVGTLIAVGGVNTDTGVPNTLSLKAPAGSTTINPLTTMIQAVVDTSPGISAAAAASRVASRLGLDLDEGVGLLHYDPIAATTSADPTISAVALSAQKLAAQVATMMTLASNAAAVLAGAANAYGAADVADQVVKSLADQISNAVTTDPVVQLADANTVHALLTIALLGTEVSAAQQALIQNAIVDASNAIGAAMDLGAITAAQSQALDDLPPAAPAIWVPGPSGGMTPSVQVHFDTTATDGSAVVAGDTVMLQDSGQPTGVTATLGIADIAAGFVTIAAPGLTGDGHLITAALVDRAGNVSAASALLPAHSETFAVLPAQAGLVALVGGSDNDYRDDVPLPKFEEVFHQPGETMIATDTMVNVEVQPFMVADTAIRQVDLDLAHRAIPQII